MTHAAPHTSGRRVLLTPGRDDLIDAGALFSLVVIALIGFRTTYSGDGYLVAGVSGLVLGIVIAHLANALRQPLIAVAAMAVAAFFLLGGAIALRADAIGGVLPSARTFHGLASSSVDGWKDLLTTLPPVDGSGPLLVLPYMIGLLAGASGLCLARRVRTAFAPVLVPFAVLIAVILLGTQTPPARLLQGAVFGVIALAWAALRAARSRAVVLTGGGRPTRIAMTATLLSLAGAGAWLVGPHLPGADAHQRTVLRSYVTPPFDVGQYPSPLAGFRKYTRPAKDLYDKTLFTVTGLVNGTPIRIATLDAYDGSTWTASNRPAAPGTPAATFQRVGSTIADPAKGTPVSFTVNIAAGYDDVWLPDAGAMTGIVFHGVRAGSHATYFRYNLATGTGIVPDIVSAGDSYTVHAVLPTHPDLSSSDEVATNGALPDDVTAFLKTPAEQWSASAAAPTDKVLALARHLYTVGKFSDGGKGYGIYLPGHSEWRLNMFLNGVVDSQIVGDDEQYAATLALMINELGTPARVVLGATPSSGTVTGADVHAWVEVQLADGSWREIPTDQFMNRLQTPTTQPPKQQEQSAGKIVPPPARVRPHSSVDDAQSAVSRSSRHVPSQLPQHGSTASGWSLPTWVVTTATWGGPPVLLFLAVIGSIVGIKLGRRRRRRVRGSPATRVVHGWREVVDHARDLGATIAGARTRREQAARLAAHDLAALAYAADVRVFGPVDPQDDAAVDYWRQVDAARRRMSQQVGRWRRFRAAISLRSLRQETGRAAEGAA